MDVRLPDGTVIKNVPDGTTKAQLATKLQSNGYDISKLGMETPSMETPQAETTFGGVASEIGKGALRGAGSVGQLIGEGFTAPLGPLGVFAKKGLQALSAPSREIVSPTPSTEAERFAGTASEIVGAGVAGGGMGSLKSALGNLAAGLGGATGEQVGGTTGRVIGTLAPGVGGGLARTAKNAVAAKAAPVVDTFKSVGAMPSAGQATGNVFLTGLENLATKFPGGAGVMKKFVESQQRSIGATSRTGVPAEAAGRAIEKGVTGAGGFLERTKATWNQLDDALAAKVGQHYNIPPVHTMKALDDLVIATPGAERTTSALINKDIAAIRDGFRADVVGNLGGIPFAAVRNLRSRVGAGIDNAMVTGIPGGELKKIYAAMSKDMEVAAKAVGAGKEFSRQSNFYRARMGRIEDVLDRVIGKGKQPEDIFKAINPTDPDQANKLRAVLRSLQPAERLVVSEAVVNRLGRATAGKQDDIGSVFSSETFLTNWNKLSPGAKAQLFPDNAMRQNLESIAKASSNIRTGSGVYANPSGTAGSFAAYSVYSSPIVSIATGSPAPLVAAAGASGAAFVGAKMLTNPKVVEWLAKSVNPVKAGEAAVHLARLNTIFKSADEGLKEELEQFVNSAQ